MKYIVALSLLFLMVSGCKEDESFSDPIVTNTILLQLAEDYEQLPEKMVTVNLDSTIFAQYALPTSKYTHGILGDRIEAEQLVVVENGAFYELTLEEPYLFEDIRPRIYDVDNDNQPEYITIRTHVERGGALAIYKVINGQLMELSSIPEIGIPNRWLNVATINDLDDNGSVEIAWVETPHIGGTLKVASVENGNIVPKDEVREYSNHAIGEINLCLSALTNNALSKQLYVPNQTRDRIVGFSFRNDKWIEGERIDFDVDFSLPLQDQYSFDNLIDEEGNCIY